jgi:predicted Zn finger-like uncharacterized protein
MRGYPFVKLDCPVCKTAYAIPDEKLSGSAMQAECKKCGAKMIINGESRTAQAISAASTSPREAARHQEAGREPAPTLSTVFHASEPEAGRATPPKPVLSVASMSPEYPRYRDALIIGSVALILISLVAGSYLLMKGAETTLQEFTQKPIEYVSKLIRGPETYKICESFLRQSEKQFPDLGRGLQISRAREHIKVVNGKKTARVSIEVRGSKGTKNVLFQLKKRNGKWHIVSVALERGKGKYETLYP